MITDDERIGTLERELYALRRVFARQLDLLKMRDYQLAVIITRVAGNRSEQERREALGDVEAAACCRCATCGGSLDGRDDLGQPNACRCAAPKLCGDNERWPFLARSSMATLSRQPSSGADARLDRLWVALGQIDTSNTDGDTDRMITIIRAAIGCLS